MRRRTILKAGGASIATGATAMLAGCTGEGGNSSNGSGSTSFTLGTVHPDKGTGIDGYLPVGYNDFVKRVEDNSNITGEVVFGGQLCAEGTCPDKVVNGVLEIGATGFANSAAAFPANAIWTLPYVFPDYNAFAYTLTRAKTWEKFWVPFAKKYGVIPLWTSTPFSKQILLSSEHMKTVDDPSQLRTPSAIKGLQLRVSKSPASRTAVKTWGGEVVDMIFSDSLQALKAGDIDGMELNGPSLSAFKLGDIVDHVIVPAGGPQRGATGWTASAEGIWASVDWLKSLSGDEQQAIANASKSVWTELLHLSHEVAFERVGLEPEPASGTYFAENDITVSRPSSEDEYKAWTKSVKADTNRSPYQDIINSASQLMSDPLDYLWETGRSSDIPDDPTNLEIEATWIDYIDQL